MAPPSATNPRRRSASPRRLRQAPRTAPQTPAAPESLTPGQRMRQEELKEELKERKKESLELLKARKEEKEKKEKQDRVVDDLEERCRRKFGETSALIRKIHNPL